MIRRAFRSQIHLSALGPVSIEGWEGCLNILSEPAPDVEDQS